MDWTTLIQDNFSAFIALVGTIIGFLGALLKDHLSRKSELQYKQLAWQEEYQ